MLAKDTPIELAPREQGRYAGWFSLALTLGAVLVFLWPVLGDPTGKAIGLPIGEGVAHLWGLWVTTTGLAEHGPLVRVAPVFHPAPFFKADLIDPSSLLVFVPVYHLAGRGPGGAALAWNSLHLFTILLAGLGAFRLARRLLGRGPACAVAVAAAVGAPYLHGGFPLGRTEYLAGAWYALHLSFLIDHLGPRRRLRDTVLAILTLAVLSLSGWPLATWILLAEIPIALAFVQSTPGSVLRRAIRLAEVGLPVLILAISVLLEQLAIRPPWMARLANASPLVTDVPVLPLSNLLRFWPVEISDSMETPAYPGLVLVGLAVAGAVLRPRQALPWLGLAVSLWLLSLGLRRSVDLGDEPFTFAGPAAYLAHVIPPLRAIKDWSRMSILVALPLGLCAAQVVKALSISRPRQASAVALALCAAIALDGMTYRPHGTGAFTVRPPDGLVKVLSKVRPGPLMVLPVRSGPKPLTLRERFAGMARVDAMLLWSHQIGRPVSDGPQVQGQWGPIALVISRLANKLDGCGDRCPDLPPDSELRRLSAHGYVGVLVDRRRLFFRERGWPETLPPMHYMGPPAYKDEDLILFLVPREIK